MKKLINRVEDVLSEQLIGLAKAHPELTLHQDPVYVTRADAPVAGKVALLSGGGSALFGLFDNEAAACAARSALQDHPLLEGVFLCRPLPFGAFEAVRNSLRNPS